MSAIGGKCLKNIQTSPFFQNTSRRNSPFRKIPHTPQALFQKKNIHLSTPLEHTRAIFVPKNTPQKPSSLLPENPQNNLPLFQLVFFFPPHLKKNARTKKLDHFTNVPGKKIKKIYLKPPPPTLAMITSKPLGVCGDPFQKSPKMSQKNMGVRFLHPQKKTPIHQKLNRTLPTTDP